MDQSNIPQLRFSNINEKWSKKSFEEIFDFKNGYNPPVGDYGIGIKYINVLDIINNNFIFYDKILGLAKADELIKNKFSVKYGDILFQRSSETREEVGQANVYIDKVENAIFGGFVIRGRPKIEINSIFINYALKTQNVRKDITSMSGGSTRYNIGQDSLNKIYLSIPDKKEQQKIASFLSSVDSKIEKLTRKKELLEEYKKGVMQKIFSQEIRFKDDDGNDYPNWEDKRLGELSKINTGESNKVDAKPNGKFRFFDRSGDILMSNKFLFDCEALIVPGEGAEFLPKYFTGKFDLHQRAYTIHSFKGLVCKYLNYYMTYYKNYLIKYAVGSTVKSLRLPIFEKMIIFLPSLTEQEKIASFLSSVDSKVESVSSQIDKTKEFKKGLLQQMFV